MNDDCTSDADQAERTIELPFTFVDSLSGVPATGGVYLVYETHPVTGAALRLLFVGSATGPAGMSGEIRGQETRYEWSKLARYAEPSFGVAYCEMPTVEQASDAVRAAAALIQCLNPPCNEESVDHFMYGPTQVNVTGNAPFVESFNVETVEIVDEDCELPGFMWVPDDIRAAFRVGRVEA